MTGSIVFPHGIERSGCLISPRTGLQLPLAVIKGGALRPVRLACMAVAERVAVTGGVAGATERDICCPDIFARRRSGRFLGQLDNQVKFVIGHRVFLLCLKTETVMRGISAFSMPVCSGPDQRIFP